LSVNSKDAAGIFLFFENHARRPSDAALESWSRIVMIGNE
jgi:hypothetical protein